MYKDPTIYNVDLTTADTEYSQAIPDETSRVIIKSRNYSEIKIAWTEGESGTNFITIPATGTKELNLMQLKGKTLYMQSPDGSDVAEIECWK